MESFVITIGREFGSLGRQTGLRTAQLLAHLICEKFMKE